MNQLTQFTNHSHPRTLSAAVILGYIQGVFSLLRVGGSTIGMLVLLAGIGLLAGSFLSANDRKVGHTLLMVCSGLGALLSALILLLALLSSQSSAIAWLNVVLRATIESVFPIALFAAVIHPQSRNWVKTFFT